MKSYEIVSEKYYAIEPSHSCGLSGGFLGTLGFSNSSLLVHGSSGCGFAMRYGLSQHWKSFIPCPVTSFHERDVIFGGVKLLKQGIEKIERVNTSDILFILTTCSSEIIGDDLEEVAIQESEDRNKKVIVVEVGGASGNTFDGYNDFLYKVVKDFNERFWYPGKNEYKKNDKKQIDILGLIPLYDMFFRGDMKEIKRVLQRFDINVNSFFTGDCSVDKVQQMFHSDLIISMSNLIGKKTINKLKKVTQALTHQFSIAPIGFDYTKEFFLKIGSLLNVDRELIKSVLEEEELKARKQMLRGFDFSKVMFTSGRVAIIGEPSRTIALTNFLLNELGMKSVIIAFTSKVQEYELEILDQILKVRDNRATVLIKEDNYLIRQLLSETKPNLVFGRSIDRLKDLKKTAHITWQFPATNRLVIYDKPYLGFTGTVSIVDDIVNAFSSLWY
ncbi:hypothetical protein HSX37_06945|uniref:Light-independent protochlorophyllide reductase, B subunit n=1 Tax=Dendrosporobacter quercicolus TaxID=146817 RepID=A0A1G9VWN9_9FIRM|nr:nitrogenase component 1 [Dendrosporobacter quercicolus]NSL47780.1 hypothetical protein [Dendrosporobacter quercicolus DSM 1736]SDM76610.1 light-independent protochlorophyllide reductase, B subunit [Dendrosporobacter quercicolus]